MTNVMLVLALIGKPKFNDEGCTRVVDILIDIEVKELEKNSEIKPSKDLSEIKKWSKGCHSRWKNK